MRTLTTFLFLILFLASTNCNTTSNSEEDAETLAAKAKLIEADAGFSIDLFKAVHANDSSSTNIFISPLSASMALGMTMNGASGNTLFEMQNTLGFPDMTQEEINKGYKSLKRQLERADEEVDFSIANSVWSKQDHSVKESFTNTVKEYFDAETASLDFSNPKTLDVINGWVAEKTNDRIKKIINFISPDDVMFLINAVYFNGSWKYEFDPESTQPFSFNKTETDIVEVEMMNQKNFAGYLINEDISLLQLPYGNEAFSMMFIKSNRENVTIDELIENELTSTKLNEWESAITLDTAQYYIPKLELEYKRQMNDDLSDLGMHQVFSPSAELDKLFEDATNLRVTSVLHKTFLKMDEEGTEAAGVTAVTVGVVCACGPPEPPTLIFDQPYLIILREKASGAILFIGKIGSPVAE